MIDDVRLTAGILAIGILVALGTVGFIVGMIWRDRRRRQREARAQAAVEQAAANAHALRKLAAEFEARRVTRH